MKFNKSPPHLLIFIFAIAAAVILTLVLIELVMHPPPQDLWGLGRLLVFTGVGSAIVGLISQRLGWWRQMSSISHTLSLGYLVAAGLTLFNVWLTARWMFINQHDLALATMLLVFAAGISISFGSFLSNSITTTLRELVSATKKLSQGDFPPRVTVTGRDEVAQLAQTFNDMVVRLQAADLAERSLDEARRNLVAWASHDLRTPLASLRAMIEAISDGIADDPETQLRYLKQSQSEIARMSSLIDDLFELAQLDAGGFEISGTQTSLSDLISDILGGIAVRAQNSGVQIFDDISPAVDPIWLAPEKIERVLQNLLENALRHTPGGGTIHINAYLEDQMVIVEIEDNGVGISPDDLPHIFDRFYRGEKSRVRDAGVGAGLGLSITKGIIEAHHGRIWIESSSGIGTKISFSIPKNLEKILTGKASHISNSARNLNTQRIN